MFLLNISVLTSLSNKRGHCYKYERAVYINKLSAILFSFYSSLSLDVLVLLLLFNFDRCSFLYHDITSSKLLLKVKKKREKRKRGEKKSFNSTRPHTLIRQRNAIQSEEREIRFNFLYTIFFSPFYYYFFG